MVFDRDKYIKYIIDNDVVGFFDRPVKLKSGRESRWYANWRTVASDAFLLDGLAAFLLAFLHDKGIAFDIIYGVPDGATKLGIVAQLAWAKQQKDFAPGSHALLMGRGAPKEHGVAKDRYFLGDPMGRVVVVEDVTTTGGSLLSAIASLKEAGAQIVAAVGLTNRLQLRDDGKSVEEAVKAQGVPYYAMSTAQDVLPRAGEKHHLSDDIKRAIEQEFKDYGAMEIAL